MNLHAEGNTPSPSPALSEPQVLPGARTALILLLSINLFNYIDRFVLAAVLPTIEETFLHDDPYAATKLGFLNTGFLISYMVLAPLFGWLADRASRWFLIGVGVILWSLASGASGLSHLAPAAFGYWVLLATRCFVGVGEAAYGPVAPTLISDMYPVRVRGKVLAFFFAAIPVGSALGYLLGGQIEAILGWQWAFYLVVPPGIALGLVCFFMREPARGQADTRAEMTNGATGKRPSGWHDYGTLLRNPSYVLNTLGMTAMTFAVGGIAFFMPRYVFEREGKCKVSEEIISKLEEVPEYSSKLTAAGRSLLGKGAMPLKEFREKVRTQVDDEKAWAIHGSKLVNACCEPSLVHINTVFGGIVVVSGLIATLLGGWVGDLLKPRFPGSYFLVSGLSMLVGFPMVLLVIWAPFPLAWVFVFLAVFFLFFNTGPTNTILANVTHPSIRATGFAFNILVIHTFGDAVSPAIIGFITDVTNSMDLALGVVAAVVLLGGGFWLWGTVYLERDTARASTRMGT